MSLVDDFELLKLENGITDKELTDENRDKLLKLLNKKVETDKDLKVLKDIKENKENYTIPKELQSTRTMIKIDPATGERTQVAAYNIDEKDMKDTLESMGSASNIDINDITTDDVFDARKKSNIMPQDNRYDINQASAIQLIKILNRYKKDKNFNIYNELPDDIKSMIDKYMSTHYYGRGYSSKVNQIRNFLARQLIEEFYNNIHSTKLKSGFINSLESIWKNSGTNLLDFYKDYPEKKDEYLDSMMKTIEDKSKINEMRLVLDSIYDSYTLDRMINSGKKFKIKPYEYERPDKVFNNIESKYVSRKEYNITSLRIAYNILCRYNEDSEENLQFLLIFSKFCSNYNIDYYPDHAFIHYCLDNITLLDVANLTDDNEFKINFIDHIHKVVKNLLK